MGLTVLFRPSDDGDGAGAGTGAGAATGAASGAAAGAASGAAVGAKVSLLSGLAAMVRWLSPACNSVRSFVDMYSGTLQSTEALSVRQCPEQGVRVNRR